MKSLDSIKNMTVLDPCPQEWFNEDRTRYIKAVLGPVSSLLKDSGHLEDILTFWIKDEVSREYLDLLPSKKTKIPSGIDKSFDESFLDTINANNLNWSYTQWGHRLESLYLSQKDRLDNIRFKMIRVNNRELAFELFLRLKDGTNSFDELSIRFGEGPEKRNGGQCQPQSVHSMPDKLKQLISRANPGDFIKPFSFGKHYAVVQFDQWEPATLDSKTKNKLMSLEFSKWSSSLVEYCYTLLDQTC